MHRSMHAWRPHVRWHVWREHVRLTEEGLARVGWGWHVVHAWWADRLRGKMPLHGHTRRAPQLLLTIRGWWRWLRGCWCCLI